MTPEFAGRVAALPPEQKARVVHLLRERERLANLRTIDRYFPDEDKPGFPARERYPRHMEFLSAHEFAVLFMAGNGVGKTESGGGYALACHARGWYPEWWTGPRFDRPVDIWAAGRTREETRDIIQTKLLGKPYEEGTGLIPPAWIDFKSIKRVGNTAGAIESFRIKRADGGHSYIGLKSYEQGYETFVGTEKDFIWLDEPPPVKVFGECVARTRTRTSAHIRVTATPKEGRTETIKLFLDEADPTRRVVTAGWDHAPHLTELEKRQIIANTPAYLRDTVRTGIPTRGQGAVYPVQESSFVIRPIPFIAHAHWAFGMDTGYHNTAAVWGMWDKDSDVVYIVSDYKNGGPGTNHETHSTVIQTRNRAAFQFADMPGVADAASINTTDGTKTLALYKKSGLNLELPDKAVVAGLTEVLSRIETGRLKVFDTCTDWLEEFRQYSYDENEKVIKTNDHLMDATRYLVMSGLKRAKQRQRPRLHIQETRL